MGGCRRDVELNKRCCCGKFSVTDTIHTIPQPPRLWCTDPMVTCTKSCSRPLSCGAHSCKMVSPRDLMKHHPLIIGRNRNATTARVSRVMEPNRSNLFFKMRCSPRNPAVMSLHNAKSVDKLRGGCSVSRDTVTICSVVFQGSVPVPMSGPLTHSQVCGKMLSCGRHRCTTKCCNDQSHVCGALCRRTLSCKSHVCEVTCLPLPFLLKSTLVHPAYTLLFLFPAALPPRPVSELSPCHNA